MTLTQDGVIGTYREASAEERRAFYRALVEELKLDPTRFERNFGRSKLVVDGDGSGRLLVQNSFWEGYVRQNYGQAIRAAGGKINGHGIRVDLGVDSSLETSNEVITYGSLELSSGSPRVSDTPRVVVSEERGLESRVEEHEPVPLIQAGKTSELDPYHRFEKLFIYPDSPKNFVSHNGIRIPLLALDDLSKAVASGQDLTDQPYTHLALRGPSGSGKTALLAKLVERLRHDRKYVAYATLNSIAEHLSDTYDDGGVSDPEWFKAAQNQAQVLVLDGLEGLFSSGGAPRPGTQKRVLTLLESAFSKGIPIVATLDGRSPDSWTRFLDKINPLRTGKLFPSDKSDDTKAMRRKLRTNVGGLTPVDVNLPAGSSRVAFTKGLLESYGVERNLDSKAVYIDSRIPPYADIRLIQAQVRAEAMGERYGVSSDKKKPGAIGALFTGFSDPREVIDLVSQFTGVRADAITNGTATKPVVHARHLCAVIITEDLGMKQTEAARILGYGAASTVSQNMAKIRELRRTDSSALKSPVSRELKELIENWYRSRAEQG